MDGRAGDPIQFLDEAVSSDQRFVRPAFRLGSRGDPARHGSILTEPHSSRGRGRPHLMESSEKRVDGHEWSVRAVVDDET